MGSGPLPRWEQQDAESQTVQPGASTGRHRGAGAIPGGLSRPLPLRGGHPCLQPSLPPRAFPEIQL